jgi:hypothetical protein
LCVLGKVEDYGTGASAAGYVEGSAYGPGYVFGSADLIGPLGDGLGDAYEVAFLKGVATEHGYAYLSGDYYDRGAVHHGVGYAGQRVGGAGTAGHEAYTYFTAYACVSLCGVGCTLFVAYQYVV